MYELKFKKGQDLRNKIIELRFLILDFEGEAF